MRLQRFRASLVKIQAWRVGRWLPCTLAWCAFAVVCVNVLAFTMQVGNPTLMADDWYFLSAFGEHAIHHTLSLADFFVRRNGPDHAEPVIKAVLLWCIRSFHYDLSVEAVVGTFAAIAYALLFWTIIFRKEYSSIGWRRYLGWFVIAALLLSLNSTVLWSWSENSMQYTSDILIPAFFIVVWISCTKKSYWLLPIITLLMMIVGDDNGIIALIAAVIALFIYACINDGVNRRAILIVAGEILFVAVIVRVGYFFAPHLGGVRVSPVGSFASVYHQLSASSLRDWIVPPLVWGVVSRPLAPTSSVLLNAAVTTVILIVTLALQIWFWIKAARSEWNAFTFVAVGIMLVFYGWLAGILLYRVPVWGSVSFSQPRYVRLYEFQIISFVLMWLGTIHEAARRNRRTFSRWTGVTACALVIAIQLPLSISAWKLVPYIRAYYQQQARQTYALSEDPTDKSVLRNCNPQLPLCEMPEVERAHAIISLRNHRLGIFSGDVVRAHGMLLTAAAVLPAPTQVALVQPRSVVTPRASWYGLYTKVRSLFLGDGEGAPRSTITVASLPSSVVPVLLHGCWPSDNSNGYVSSWCGPSTTFVLRAPQTRSMLQIHGWFPEDLYAKAGHREPVVVTVSVNGVVVTRAPLLAGGRFRIDAPFAGAAHTNASNGVAFVDVSTGGLFVVPSAFSDSKDKRTLSLKIASVGFVAP